MAKEKTNTADAVESKDKSTAKVADSLAKIGRRLLAANPAMKEIYMTSDGRGFYEHNDAENHARTLNNKSVSTVKR